MKRTLSIFLTLALMLTLAACGSTSGQGSTGSKPTPTPEGNALVSATPEATPENQPEDTTPPENETPEGTSDDGKKILIAYFSATNNTENIANYLNEILEPTFMRSYRKRLIPPMT